MLCVSKLLSGFFFVMKFEKFICVLFEGTLGIFCGTVKCTELQDGQMSSYFFSIPYVSCSLNTGTKGCQADHVGIVKGLSGHERNLSNMKAHSQFSKKSYAHVDEM